MGLTCLPLCGETWYVRRDGGTRYSSNNHKGQCDGKADAAYTGGGANRHCAFNDVRYLWTDGSYTVDSKSGAPSWGWIGSGGDTYIIHDGPWRIGQSGPNNADSFGLHGNPYDAGAPPPPNGTAGQHTQILGANYANCGSPASMTQLHAGYGVNIALNLNGAKFVDIKCIELTRHSQCIKFGNPAVPSGCRTSFPLDDYASNGITTTNQTHDILLQDMYIHGFTSRGIIGPIGGTVTATRVDIAYNGGAGWDFDDGSSTPMINGVLNLSYVTIEWNGCNQAYPGTGAISCYSQSTGGYGDGIGTPGGTCIAATVDHSIFRYNTQDGLDMLHMDKGTCPLTITNSMAYGNNGQQFKWGPAQTPAVFTNNVAIGNCFRLSQPMPGQPAGYNANLTDFCRAENTVVPNLRPGGTLLMANNTFISYAPTFFDVQCLTNDCSTATMTFKNNIVLGYDNPVTYNSGGKSGGPGVFYTEHPVNIVRSNNIYYGVRGMRLQTLFSNEKIGNPMFISQPALSKEQDLDGFNLHLSSESPAHGLGASVP